MSFIPTNFVVTSSWCCCEAIWLILYVHYGDRKCNDMPLQQLRYADYDEVQTQIFLVLFLWCTSQSTLKMGKCFVPCSCHEAVNKIKNITIASKFLGASAFSQTVTDTFGDS